MAWKTPAEKSLLSISREAMKGEFEILFPRKDFPQGTEAAMDALDEVERLEKILSVFRFDSRIQYVNLTAHDEPVRLNTELFDLVAFCLDLAESTGGAVDITSGPLWKTWGFAKRQGRVPQPEEIKQAMQSVGYRFVELDPEHRTIFFKKKGVELNFGCVGKGFALDVGAKKLRRRDVDNFLFQGGLSSMLAAGNDWTVGIAHPMRPGNRLAELRLSNQAVGTSSSTKQFFRYRGHRYSHLIDPRTGWPSEHVLSVTVLAPTATEAELLSTAFFVLGADDSEEFCKKRNRQDIAALFVLPSPKGPRYEIKQFGFDQKKLRFLSAENEVLPPA